MKTSEIQRALALAQSPPPFGLLTEAFIDCFGEFLDNVAEVAENANRKRLQHVSPLLGLLRDARNDVVSRFKALLPIIPVIDLLEFERLIRASYILKEVDAFNTFCVAPSELVSDSEKASKAEEIAKSLKEVLKKLRQKAKNWGWPFNGKPINDVFDALDEAIDEIIKLLAPPKPEEPH